MVMRGSGRMKLDNEIVEQEWDAVRPSRYVARLRGRAGGLRSSSSGAPNLGEAPREDVDGQRDWWADPVAARQVTFGRRDSWPPRWRLRR